MGVGKARQRSTPTDKFSLSGGKILIDIIRQSTDYNKKVRAAKKLATIISKLSGPEWVMLSQAVDDLLNQDIPPACKQILKPDKLKRITLPLQQ